jgi:hypothetical protein
MSSRYFNKEKYTTEGLVSNEKLGSEKFLKSQTKIDDEVEDVSNAKSKGFIDEG